MIAERPARGIALTITNNFAKEKSPQEEGENYPLANEASSYGVEILHPLQITGDPKVDTPIQKELEYLSRTRSLEIGTERTQILQNIVDAMAKDTNVKARVIIINKGEEAEAFCLPDGSICISQSLINALDTIDEVAGVEAHELEHVINESSKRSKEAHPAHSLGVGWINEAVSDSLSPYLLEKAGLNTLGLASAIQKISHNERGIIHQSGEARAAQNVGLHLGIDFSTSSQETTPIPSILKTDRVGKTNLAITEKIIEKKILKL